MRNHTRGGRASVKSHHEGADVVYVTYMLSELADAPAVEVEA
jgi:hypothetical protein